MSTLTPVTVRVPRTRNNFACTYCRKKRVACSGNAQGMCDRCIKDDCETCTYREVTKEENNETKSKRAKTNAKKKAAAASSSDTSSSNASPSTSSDTSSSSNASRSTSSGTSGTSSSSNISLSASSFQTPLSTQTETAGSAHRRTKNKQNTARALPYAAARSAQPAQPAQQLVQQSLAPQNQQTYQAVLVPVQPQQQQQQQQQHQIMSLQVTAPAPAPAPAPAHTNMAPAATVQQMMPADYSHAGMMQTISHNNAPHLNMPVKTAGNFGNSGTCPPVFTFGRVGGPQMPMPMSIPLAPAAPEFETFHQPAAPSMDYMPSTGLSSDQNDMFPAFNTGAVVQSDFYHQGPATHRDQTPQTPVSAMLATFEAAPSSSGQTAQSFNDPEPLDWASLCETPFDAYFPAF